MLKKTNKYRNKYITYRSTVKTIKKFPKILLEVDSTQENQIK